jgi:FCD domain
LGKPQTYRKYLRANSVFHRALVRCTGNSLLETMVTSALDRHQRPLYLGLDKGLDAAASTSEHLALVSAIELRDAARAQEVMFDHVSDAEERIVSALRPRGTNDTLIDCPRVARRDPIGGAARGAAGATYAHARGWHGGRPPAIPEMREHAAGGARSRSVARPTWCSSSAPTRVRMGSSLTTLLADRNGSKGHE